MRFLLDTHIFISLNNKDEKLSQNIINTVENSEQNVFSSIASLWKIIIKINIGKLIVTRNLQEMYEIIETSKLSVLNIQKQHLDKHLSLPFILLTE